LKIQFLINESKSSDVFCLKFSGEGSKELKSGELESTNFTPHVPRRYYVVSGIL